MMRELIGIFIAIIVLISLNVSASFSTNLQDEKLINSQEKTHLRAKLKSKQTKSRALDGWGTTNSTEKNSKLIKESISSKKSGSKTSKIAKSGFDSIGNLGMRYPGSSKIYRRNSVKGRWNDRSTSAKSKKGLFKEIGDTSNSTHDIEDRMSDWGSGKAASGNFPSARRKSTTHFNSKSSKTKSKSDDTSSLNSSTSQSKSVKTKGSKGSSKHLDKKGNSKFTSGTVKSTKSISSIKSDTSGQDVWTDENTMWGRKKEKNLFYKKIKQTKMQIGM